MIAAVVPAAGRSDRMGRPKLLLEFEGETLIDRVVTALREGGAERVVVVPPADAPEAAAIAAEAAAAGAEVLVPETQPAEMRDSIELGLAVLDAEPRPDSVLLTPGDVPGITPRAGRPAPGSRPRQSRSHRDPDPRRPSRTSDRLALEHRAPRSATSPTTPASTRWSTRHQRPCPRGRRSPTPGAIDDLDTPEDLERWIEQADHLTDAPVHRPQCR